MYQNDPCKVLTGEVRLSYANLSTPKPPMNNPTAEPKYSVTLLIPKRDTATKADIDQSFEAAARAAVNEKWGGVRPPVIQSIIHDGDGVRQNGTPFGPECRGHWVLTASSKNKPGVVHISNLKCELDPKDIYSGMYGRATIRFYGFNSGGTTRTLRSTKRSWKSEESSVSTSTRLRNGRRSSKFPKKEPGISTSGVNLGTKD